MTIFDAARVFLSPAVPEKTSLTSQLRAVGATVSRKLCAKDNYVVVVDADDDVVSEAESLGISAIVYAHFITDHIGKTTASTDAKYFVKGDSNSNPSGKAADKKAAAKPSGKAAKKAAGDAEDEDEKASDEPATKKAAAKTATRTSGRNAKKADDDADDDEKMSDDKPTAKKATGKAAAKADKATPAPAAAAAPTTAAGKRKAAAAAAPAPAAAPTPAAPASDLKTVKVVGRAAVDEHVPNAGAFVVHYDNTLVYDFMLNQTNIGQNNNKFYLVQVLRGGSAGYATWFRWGRVGVVGQSSFQTFGALNDAINFAERKFRDKSGGHSFMDTLTPWHSVPGKYTFIQRVYATDDELKELEEAENEDGESAIPDCTLDPRVQSLMEMICNIEMMKQQMLEVGYDAKRLPLGKISKDVVKKGYDTLNRISLVVDVLEEKTKVGSNGRRGKNADAPAPAARGRKKKDDKDAEKEKLAAMSESQLRLQLQTLSSDFYTVIPHSFGMSVPPTINTPQMVKDKIALLESLDEIECANKLIKLNAAEKVTVHPADQHYQRLNCELTPVEKDDDMFGLLTDYVKNTHGHTHTWTKVQVQEIFRVNRKDEADRFEAAGHHLDTNKQLLWHGSRLTNFVGILSQGLRIAPPNAPVTGYMFGKGVYTADMVTKSANYCVGNSAREACILLCEVALGDMNELVHSDYNASDLPDGKLSTKGLGRTVPNDKEAVFVSQEELDGAPATVTKKGKGNTTTAVPKVKIPMGKSTDADRNDLYLQYNEYIVYSVDQIRMRYLIRFKFA